MKGYFMTKNSFVAEVTFSNSISPNLDEINSFLKGSKTILAFMTKVKSMLCSVLFAEFIFLREISIFTGKTSDVMLRALNSCIS